MTTAVHRALSPLGVVILISSGCLIGILTFGPRATMGLFLVPMTDANGWSREAFAFSIAIQNLVWGMAQPFAGMLADRYGTARVLSVGAVLYAVALFLMAHTTDPILLQFTTGVLMGLGLAGAAFFLVMAAFARLLPENVRTLGFGLATASGSLGQFIFAPLGQGFIESYGFMVALYIMAACVIVVPLLTLPLRGKSAAPAAGEVNQSIRSAISEAFNHRSYQLLVAGFFVCGFHVAFITVHLPPFLADQGVAQRWGAIAIALIGLFNIIGAISSGYVSDRISKRWVLSWIYFARAIAIAVFVFLPITPVSTLIFASVMGLLWLSTIPPTQGLVTVMFGTRYAATLFGFTFFSHQVGSFLGIWLGGRIYDATGSYDIVWYIGIALGLIAAVIHLPIVEKPVQRPALATG